MLHFALIFFIVLFYELNIYLFKQYGDVSHGSSYYSYSW